MRTDQINHVYTSGQAALNYLKTNLKDKDFYHIGPPRDFDLFLNFQNNKKENLDASKYILCTGLYDDKSDDLNFYKDLLEKYIHKKMICTNPDLIVDRGNKRELCAGSVAMVFEKMGGKVIYFGKPYPEVYNQAIDNKDKKILCIGDNLNTDIKGANLQNFDSLIISPPSLILILASLSFPKTNTLHFVGLYLNLHLDAYSNAASNILWRPHFEVAKKLTSSAYAGHETLTSHN